MPSYEYRARTRGGKLTTGKIQAENERSVAGKLQAMGYFPIAVSESVTVQQEPGAARRSKSTRIRSRDIALFTRQLSDLLTSGLPLLRALNTLLKQSESAGLHRVTEDLRNVVQGGGSLADAVAKHPRLFRPIYVGMVKAGEAGGILEATLARLAEFQERDADLRARMRAAMAYPIFMACIGVATIIFLLVVVIPRFLEVMEEFDQTLPLPTLMLQQLSNFLSGFGGLVIAGILFIIILGVMRIGKTVEGSHAIDRLKLRLPGAGNIVRRAAIARFARTLGTLTGSGVPILSALEMASGVVGNHVFVVELERAQKGVREGGTLAGQLGRGNEFPPAVVDMVAVGEEAGNIDAALVRVADTYDRDVENSIRTAMSLMEPAMILVMGVVVGFIVAAMILPIFQLSAGIGG